VGARPRPGSTGRLNAGGARKFDHLARYAAEGAHIIDEETGEYSEYEVTDSEAHAVEWDQILDQPGLIFNDFLSEYGLDLRTLGNRLSWREFAVRVEGLLAADTRIARHFAPDPKPSVEV
jgi:hypothetical protein